MVKLHLFTPKEITEALSLLVAAHVAAEWFLKLSHLHPLLSRVAAHVEPALHLSTAFNLSTALFQRPILRLLLLRTLVVPVVVKLHPIAVVLLHQLAVILAPRHHVKASWPSDEPSAPAATAVTLVATSC